MDSRPAIYRRLMGKLKNFQVPEGRLIHDKKISRPFRDYSLILVAFPAMNRRAIFCSSLLDETGSELRLTAHEALPPLSLK